MRILYLTNVPSPYRVEYFNRLSIHCDLTVLYEKKQSDERDSKWIAKEKDTYNCIYLQGISMGADKALNIDVLKYLRRQFDIVIICGISSPTQMLAIHYCRTHNVLYCIESDGGIVKTGKGLKERLKKHLIRGASGYFSTCYRHDQYYLAYGATKDRIYRYPFTSVAEKDVLDIPLNNEQKRIIKERLEMEEGVVAVAVGQFIYRKGFDILIMAATQTPKIGFYIVGGTPTKEYLDLKEKYNADNVHFVGFKTKDELTQYYDAADFFVLPTREDIWGLVINEAMARGLPVITTKNCNAGLEMIQDGYNGKLIEVDNVEELVNAVDSVVNSMNIYEAGIEAINTARKFTLEEMVNTHMMAFKEIIDQREDK